MITTTVSNSQLTTWVAYAPFTLALGQMPIVHD